MIRGQLRLQRDVEGILQGVELGVERGERRARNAGRPVRIHRPDARHDDEGVIADDQIGAVACDRNRVVVEIEFEIGGPQRRRGIEDARKALLHGEARDRLLARLVDDVGHVGEDFLHVEQVGVQRQRARGQRPPAQFREGDARHVIVAGVGEDRVVAAAHGDDVVLGGNHRERLEQPLRDRERVLRRRQRRIFRQQPEHGCGEAFHLGVDVRDAGRRQRAELAEVAEDDVVAVAAVDDVGARQSRRAVHDAGHDGGVDREIPAARPGQSQIAALRQRAQRSEAGRRHGELRRAVGQGRGLQIDQGHDDLTVRRHDDLRDVRSRDDDRIDDRRDVGNERLGIGRPIAEQDVVAALRRDRVVAFLPDDDVVIAAADGDRVVGGRDQAQQNRLRLPGRSRAGARRRQDRLAAVGVEGAGQEDQVGVDQRRRIG